ncbi:MAG TPA: hypothetical protein EYQ31_10140 [Candidatus Handelsmanbacteria bacterium]|nr:hypothetical protein [Candidatus Handelsmanbacteria bacterium]
MTLTSRLFTVVGMVLVFGCGGDGSTLGPDGTPIVDDDPIDGAPGNGDSTAVSVTLSQLSADIFTPKCATSGCHGSFPSAGMSLAAANIAAAIINVPSNQRPNLKRIDPGNPDGSYLLQKVRGIGANAQMPLGGTPLSAAEIQLIADWITAGAPAQ